MFFIVFSPAIAQDWKHAGLAFSTVFSSSMSCIVLSIIMQKRLGRPDWAGIASGFIRSLACASVMGLAAYHSIDHVFELVSHLGLTGKLAIVVSTLATILEAICIYVGMSVMLCRREWHDILGRRRR